MINWRRNLNQVLYCFRGFIMRQYDRLSPSYFIRQQVVPEEDNINITAARKNFKSYFKSSSLCYSIVRNLVFFFKLQAVSEGIIYGNTFYREGCIKYDWMVTFLQLFLYSKYSIRRNPRILFLKN